VLGFKVFLLLDSGLTYDTLAPAIPVIKLLAGTALPFSFSRWYDVEHHFIGLLEKVHRPPKDFKTLRLQVVIKVLPGIPFFKNTEFIFILLTPAKVAAPASLLCLNGADQ